MLFSSLTFLYYFLPAVLVLYTIAPRKLKNSVLLLTSLVFYGWGEPRCVLFMMGAILIGYICGLLMEKSSLPAVRKLLMALTAAVTLGMLCYFKYVDFFIANFNAVTGLSVPLLRVALPIGISFYTFQLLSYVIDVYRRDVPAQKNLIHLATYVALFPQLVAGPIVRYSHVAAQLEHRTHTGKGTALGCRRFILGLAKKVLLANPLGELCDIFLATGDGSLLYCWLYAVSLALHIYFDFSGYSDMAIGLGHLFGFTFMENFNYPYISKSATEFWRRWHISLGSWFRDYVYIPMGGNRGSKARWLFNIFVVWMLTGFWHGAAWNFIFWGLFFAILLAAEKLWLLKHLKRHTVLSHVYVLLAVAVSFVLFNAADIPTAGRQIAAMFGAGGLPLVSREAVYYLKSYGLILLLAAVGATPLPKQLASRLQQTAVGGKLLPYGEALLYAALLLLCTAYLVDGSFNPFLYFRF